MRACGAACLNWGKYSTEQRQPSFSIRRPSKMMSGWSREAREMAGMAVSRFTHNLHIGAGLQQQAHSLAHNGMPVNQQDANRRATGFEVI